jgi:glutamyl-tRNA synthetase
MDNTKPWRVRFAPSPTGVLHAGSVRTALFNYLAAKHTGGQFILRIEDTDQNREIEGSEKAIIDSLKWLGLNWDEGPGIEGPHGPYCQSQRLDIYKSYVQSLVDKNAAYYCVCSKEDLQIMRQEQDERKEARQYDRRCLKNQDIVLDAVKNGTPAVLRLKMPDETITWKDMVRGQISFEGTNIDDAVLLKQDGFPTYHFANVIDDHLMEITHVLRAEEWIASTPKHLALYQAFGWEPPTFIHVPLVLGPDGSKLAKRKGALDILDYRDRGYLPEALCNTMALLGWAPPGETDLLNMAELSTLFDPTKINPAPAILGNDKLEEINARHIRAKSLPEFADEIKPWLGVEVDSGQLEELASLLQERITNYGQIEKMVKPLFEMPDPLTNEGLSEGLDRNQMLSLWTRVGEVIQRDGLEDASLLNETLKAEMQELGVKGKQAWKMLYLGIFHTTTGLPLYQAMQMMGQVEVLSRLEGSSKRVKEISVADVSTATELL